MEQRLMEPIKSMGLTGVETATPPPSDDMPVSAPGQVGTLCRAACVLLLRQSLRLQLDQRHSR